MYGFSENSRSLLHRSGLLHRRHVQFVPRIDVPFRLEVPLSHRRARHLTRVQLPRVLLLEGVNLNVPVQFLPRPDLLLPEVRDKLDVALKAVAPPPVTSRELQHHFFASPTPAGPGCCLS